MLITVKKEVTQEETVEVQLPFFSVEDTRTWKNYYAVHENASMAIMIGDHVTNISIFSDSSKLNEAVRYTEITEQDFDFAYQMALDRLQKAVTNSESKTANV